MHDLVHSTVQYSTVPYVGDTLYVGDMLIINWC